MALNFDVRAIWRLVGEWGIVISMAVRPSVRPHASQKPSFLFMSPMAVRGSVLLALAALHHVT